MWRSSCRRWVRAGRAPAAIPARCCSSSSRASERTLSADQMIQELRPKLQSVPGINAYMQNPPSIRVGGSVSKSPISTRCRTPTRRNCDSSALKLMNALPHAGLRRRHHRHGPERPAVNVDIDRDQAAAQGVSVQPIETALGASFGGAADFHPLCQRCRIWVMLELEPQYQNDPPASICSMSLQQYGGGATTATGASSTGAAPSTVTNRQRAGCVPPSCR